MKEWIRDLLLAVVVGTIAVPGCAGSGRGDLGTIQPQRGETLDRDLVGHFVRLQTAEATYEGRVIRVHDDEGVVLHVSNADLLGSESTVVVPFERIEELSVVGNNSMNWRLVAGTLLGVAGAFALVRIIHPEPRFYPDYKALHN